MLLTDMFKGFEPRRYINIDEVDLKSNIEGVDYRLAEREDIVEMLAIERDVYDGEVPWTFSHFEHEIVQEENAFFVSALIEGKLVGFIGIRLTERGKVVHITNLAVSVAHQGQGIGSTLVKQMVRLMTLLGKHQMTLEVRRDNTKAQGLYRRLGFTTGKLISEYYEDGGDAVWMSRQLRNEPEN
ncbi:Ribosomal-protein-S18p-alanine acetyltransferase [Lactococcus garvieae DCC43]|uniref:Ribosomal-protein-S18p-alanine acetyltransferase n=2 Tax=Lactococcus garvieae TaxID=1363 RepID=K2PL97_9LACT|nr:Ribosomal-protein-S18p-alanine acetyltransferase [Lactococcus garvieae DCC43]